MQKELQEKARLEEQHKKKRNKYMKCIATMGLIPVRTFASVSVPGRSLRDQIFFLLRTALKDRPKGPPTANRQLPPTATNRQPPTANRDQPPTVNRCQPPPTTHHQLPTAANRRQPPPTTNRQPAISTSRQPPIATNHG